MTEYTPGGWKAEPADMFGDHNITLADDAGDCRAIAAVVANLRPEAEVAANARLIAAAPELAKGLANIFAKLDRSGEAGGDAPGHCHSKPGIWDADNAPEIAGKPCDWCAQWNEARAALAKAGVA